MREKWGGTPQAKKQEVQMCVGLMNGHSENSESVPWLAVVSKKG